MRSAPTISNISEESLDAISRELANSDDRLRRVYETYGPPPLWDREPTFPTLIHIILEQQVSLASALAAFNKLKETVGEITPENILSLSDDEMKAVYFSRQKTAYVRELSKAVLKGSMELESLKTLDDDGVRTELTKIKGIGRWTSDIFLLMALLRPDVMPVGDIALHQAWKELAGLDSRPSSEQFTSIAVQWTPYRSVAARLLWHFYLSERSRS